MFDIGLQELFLIGLVGIVVIGPEKLPSTIRTVALWISRIKRSLSEAKRELEEQIGADEIRREIYNEQVLHNLEQMKEARLELEAKIHNWKDDDVIEGSAHVEHNEPHNEPEADDNTRDNAAEDTSSASQNKPKPETQS